jgi:FKBP-type peptidyl-prolyl cis-trans isomerase SlyD
LFFAFKEGLPKADKNDLWTVLNALLLGQRGDIVESTQNTGKTPRRVFTFNYTLKGPDGQVLDASTDGPLAFLEGAGQIIPALEEEILKMDLGAKKNVKLTAESAYGLPDDKMMMDVPKAELAHLNVEVGSYLRLDLGEATKVVRITKITETAVTLDANHPLAGQDLEFDVELLTSRDATLEELMHGHAHGIGGAHHH